MTKSLAIGSLNAMGLAVAPSLVMNLKVVLMLLRRLASVIHPYPTQAEAIRQVGDMYNRTRLTPRVKRLFAAWLRWTR